MASATRNDREPRVDGIRRQVRPLGGSREYVGGLLHEYTLLNLVLGAARVGGCIHQSLGCLAFDCECTHQTNDQRRHSDHDTRYGP